jgi:serine/threonine-protein kinase
MPLTSGDRLGPYEILAPIGAGGMGEVYRARDTKLGRDVALKVLPQVFAADAERMARFRREAQVLASLNHSNIAAIYGFEDSSHVHALVMELVEGPTLADRIKTGAIPIEEALLIGRQICEAVEYAHERGVIHRDLKPANIKLANNDAVKILDFGLAKALDADVSATDISSSPTISRMATQAGIILGTAAYMSPEQAKGKTVDRRTDIWAFGCVLYEMLTSRMAFSGETVTDTLAAVIKSEPDWSLLPAATPGPIRGLLARCLKKDMRQRLQSIGDARIAIEEVLSGVQESDARRRAVPETHLQNKWSRALPWAIAGALAVVAAIACALYYQAASRLKPVMRFSLVPQTGGRFYSPGSALALSSDGTRLAYSYGPASSRKLYLRALDQPMAVPLAGTDNALTPFFSPDGRWIGFFADGKLKKISVSGGAPVTICDAPDSRGAVWGPDDTILFTPTANSSLESVRTSGGTPQDVTKLNSAPENGSRSHRYPAFLPGGKEALFDVVYPAGNPLDNADIAVVSLDTGKYTVLLHGGSLPTYVSPGYIIYAHGGDLLAVPFDASRLRVTGPPTTVVQGVSMFFSSGAANYAVSQTGTLIYLPKSAEAQPKGKLVWVSRQGVAFPISQMIHSYSSPRLVPSGKRLVVEANDDIPGIWMYDIGRDTLSPFAMEGGNGSPVVSPDGKEVAFDSFLNGVEGIVVESIEGSSSKRRVTTSTQLLRPDSFSPDGKLLVLTAGSATKSLLMLLHLEGSSAPKPLLPGAGNRTAAAISRDGRWIAYVSDESGQNEVYAEAFPSGGGRMQISSAGGAAPVWSHNGRELFYRHGNQLLAVDVTAEASLSAGKPQELFAGQYGPRVSAGEYISADYDVVPDFDVTEDGKKFVMIQSAGPIPLSETPKLEVVVNWFEELRRIAGKATQ